MSRQITPITFERHGTKSFRRFASYRFAAKETVAPLVGAELARATLSFPIAFLNEGKKALPVAVLGVEPGQNLFVAPDGRWMGAYVPAVFRGYPFALGQTQDNKQILCIDESSALVLENASGEPFFNSEKGPSEPIEKILGFLTKLHENRIATDQACEVISRCGLLEPWPIRVQGQDGPRVLSGLWRISELKMNQLADQAFLELRHTGGMALAFAQLMSMGHLPLLDRLAIVRSEANRQMTAVPASLDPVFGIPDQSDELEIDWSRFKS